MHLLERVDEARYLGRGRTGTAPNPTCSATSREPLHRGRMSVTADRVMPVRRLQYSLTLSAQETHPSEASSRRKATLFCPSCGHESEVAGDWIVHTDDARETYDCPVCNTTITKRLQEAPLLAPSD